MLLQISSVFIAFTALFVNAYQHLDTDQGNIPNTQLLKRVKYTGTGTSYKQPSTPGSCGQVSSDSAIIAALGDAWMKYSYDAPYCNKSIHVTNMGGQGNGKEMTVLITDTCTTCNATQVAFSLGAWNELTGSDSAGTADIEWYFSEYGGSGNTTKNDPTSADNSGGGAGVTSPNAPIGPGSGGGAGVTSANAPGSGSSGGGAGVTSPNAPNGPTSAARKRFRSSIAWLGMVTFLVVWCA